MVRTSNNKVFWILEPKKVILSPFKTLKEILSNNILGYTKEELTSAFYNIFGKEKVINSKIVGIKFNIIKWLNVMSMIK